MKTLSENEILEINGGIAFLLGLGIGFLVGTGGVIGGYKLTEYLLK